MSCQILLPVAFSLAGWRMQWRWRCRIKEQLCWCCCETYVPHHCCGIKPLSLLCMHYWFDWVQSNVWRSSHKMCQKTHTISRSVVPACSHLCWGHERCTESYDRYVLLTWCILTINSRYDYALKHEKERSARWLWSKVAHFNRHGIICILHYHIYMAHFTITSL